MVNLEKNMNYHELPLLLHSRIATIFADVENVSFVEGCFFQAPFWAKSVPRVQ